MRSAFLGAIGESPSGHSFVVASGMDNSGCPNMGDMQNSRNMRSRRLTGAVGDVPLWRNCGSSRERQFGKLQDVSLLRDGDFRDSRGVSLNVRVPNETEE